MFLLSSAADTGSVRSKLFVPASRPELFSKAFASAADGVSFDLEDAVAEPRKDAARAALRHFLLTDGAAHRHGKTVVVRVNGMDSAHFKADIAAAVRPGVHLINLPKPQSPQHVRQAAALIAAAEGVNGVNAPLGLLLNIETPKALRIAAQLARADVRVAGLQLGLGDLFEPLGISRGDRFAIEQAMLAVRIAAGEAGVYACDGAFADIRDETGYREEALRARALGFIGKTCIHPCQVALANAVFQPTAAEIAHALKVTAAAVQARAQGLGAYVVDARMVDAPFVLRAQAIVARARSLGLLPN